MREYQRAVVFRLGRVLKSERGPGVVLILWPIDKIVKVSLRVVTWDVPPQDTTIVFPLPLDLVGGLAPKTSTR